MDINSHEDRDEHMHNVQVAVDITSAPTALMMSSPYTFSICASSVLLLDAVWILRSSVSRP